jgi:small-conductance mechanosensitive channel
MDIPVIVSVDNDIAQVKAIIHEVLDKNENVLKRPEPMITTGKIMDGAVIINVRPYCFTDNGAAVVSDVNEALKVAFEKNRITAPMQTRLIINGKV